MNIILKKYGVEVSLAGSAFEALDELRKKKFDIIISDIAMPGMDGHEMIAVFRQMEEGGIEHTPAVAISGHADFDNRKKSYSQGFQVHLTKPVHSEAGVCFHEREGNAESSFGIFGAHEPLPGRCKIVDQEGNAIIANCH